MSLLCRLMYLLTLAPTISNVEIVIIITSSPQEMMTEGPPRRIPIQANTSLTSFNCYLQDLVLYCVVHDDAHRVLGEDPTPKKLPDLAN